MIPCTLGLWVDVEAMPLCPHVGLLMQVGTHNLSKELVCFASRFPWQWCQWPSVVSLFRYASVKARCHCKTTPGGQQVNQDVRKIGENPRPQIQNQVMLYWKCPLSKDSTGMLICDKTFDQPLAPTSFTSEHVGSSSSQVVSSWFNGYKTELQSQSTRKLWKISRGQTVIHSQLPTKIFHHCKQ